MAMDTAVLPLPDDIEALKALVLEATRQAAEATQRATEVEALLANARAQASATDALIAHFKLQIAKLRREQFGPSAERTRRLLDQMELQLEDLEADATEDNLTAATAAEKATTVAAFERKRPVRKPFPEHLTAQLAKLSRNHDLAKAINYMLRRWDAFTRFQSDGRVCLTNNAA